MKNEKKLHFNNISGEKKRVKENDEKKVKSKKKKCLNQ